MAINWKKAESREKPEKINKKISCDGVYIRQNIIEETRQDNDGNDYVMYCYDEAFLTNTEYERYLLTNDIVENVQLKHENDIIDNYTLQLLEEGIL